MLLRELRSYDALVCAVTGVAAAGVVEAVVVAGVVEADEAPNKFCRSD